MGSCPCCDIMGFYRALGGLSLGEQIRRHRVHAGLSQREVEERLGTSRGYMSKAENNQMAISIRALRKISRIIGEPLVIGPKQKDEKTRYAKP